ncbi:sulfite exporter TauE/SafE family protein [bacterium]|nr:sulfite exporter TauE/SafE family protein [bacterium]
MGIVLGSTGGGGSILTVPILAYIFKLSATHATAYSLFVVGVGSSIGAIGYFKKGQVDFKTGLMFSIPAFIGVYTVRRHLIPMLPEYVFNNETFSLSKDQLILGAFALVMLAASIPMIRERRIPTSKAKALSPLMKRALITFEGVVIGAITGFVGAGGGFVIVPALVLLANLPMKTAVGTSLFIISINSLIGFSGDLQTLDFINWAFLLKFTAFSIVGILIGSRLASRIPANTLKKGFGYFVLIMGFIILYLEVRK